MDDSSCCINNKSDNKQKQNRRFFTRPRVKINRNLSRHDIRISVSGRTTAGPLNPEFFNAIVWNIKITNKFPFLRKFIEGYTIQLRVTNIEQWLGLLWKRSDKDIIDAYSTGAGLVQGNNYRYEYQRRLGHDYSEVLSEIGTELGDIDRKQSRELFFLVTFEDSQFAFLITSSHSTDSWYDENTFSKQINDRFLMLRIPSQTEIRLRFGLDKIETRTLRINAYNDVQLHP